MGRAGRRQPRVSPESLKQMPRAALERLARKLLQEREGRLPPPRIDPDKVSADVSSALDIDWESPIRGAERKVAEHARAARQDLKGGRWEAAMLRAAGVVEGFADDYDPGEDQEGELTWDLQDAVKVVDDGLKHVRSQRSRDRAIGALMQLWWADLGHGGVGLSDDVPGVLRRQATHGERARVADEVMDRLPGTSPGYEREHGARLVLDLDGGRFKDPAYLEFCQANGLHMERVARLASRRRWQEARSVAETDVPRHQLTEAADLLVKGGHRELAVQIVEKRLQDPEDRAFHDRWMQWLQGQAEARNDLPQARKLAWERLLESPSMATYEAFKRVSKRMRSWSKNEPSALHLLQRPELRPLLTEVHVEEGRVQEALRVFRGLTKDRSWDPSLHSLQEHLARAAQKDFPSEARDLYLDLAERSISFKTRGAYSSAAPLVKLACSMGDRAGKGDGTNEILRSLYRRYPGLPALWDELGRLGLKAPGPLARQRGTRSPQPRTRVRAGWQ